MTNRFWRAVVLKTIVLTIGFFAANLGAGAVAIACVPPCCAPGAPCAPFCAPESAPATAAARRVQETPGAPLAVTPRFVAVRGTSPGLRIAFPRQPSARVSSSGSPPPLRI